MRYWLLTVGIFISVFAKAQFGFYAEGGGNGSFVRATRSPGKVTSDGGAGWQFGIGTEYHTQWDWFLYFSIDVEGKTFKKKYDSLNLTIRNYTYKPVLLNTPFGIGYEFPITKSVGLRVYGGVNVQIGLGGTVTQNATLKLDTSGERIVYNKHNINYGRSINVQSEFQSDLANTLWGLNIGAGLNFSKSVEVALMYQEGFLNILPGGDGNPEIDKLRSVMLNVKFYFPRSYYHEKQKL